MASSVVFIRNGSIWASFTGTVDVSELGVQIARSWSTFGIETTALDKAIKVRVGWAILCDPGIMSRLLSPRIKPEI